MSAAIPQISVALAVYNADEHIAEAVESILGQSFGDFEFLIVDDGSTDNSGAILEYFASRDPRIKLMRQDNRGFVPSLNRMVEAATAPWIARMDADDVAHPERFARQMTKLSAEPSIDVLGTDAHLIGPDSQRIIRPAIHRPTEHEDLFADPEYGVLALHPTLMIRTDILRACGGYRPAFRFAQDYDLFLRLGERARFANLADHLLYYRITPGQASTRHVVTQQLCATIAYLSYEARRDGRPDPMESLSVIPQLGTLDTVFGKQGCDAYARRKIVNRILYSPEALTGEGWVALMGHAGEAQDTRSLWQVAARLLKHGHPVHAARLSATLGARLMAA